jgi:acyl carrier protein
LEPELEADATELRTYLRKSLPEYMVPAAFLFLEVLPLTSSNKVDRQALKSLDIASPQPTADAVPPATPTESLMAETWQAVLGVDRISVYDNFFDLGGHSLLSMQVIARMEERTGVRINPREMIVQTLGQLARLYDERAERIDPAGKMNLGQRLRRTMRRRT